MQTSQIPTPSSNIKGKTKSLGTDKAEAKGFGFPKSTIFGSISTKLMIRVAQNWLEGKD